MAKAQTARMFSERRCVAHARVHDLAEIEPSMFGDDVDSVALKSRMVSSHCPRHVWTNTADLAARLPRTFRVA